MAVKTDNPAKSTEPKKEEKFEKSGFDLTRPELFVPVATVLVVLLAYLVQFAYDFYIVQPGIERTPLQLIDTKLSQNANFGVYDPRYILAFEQLNNNSKRIEIRLVLGEEEKMLVSDLSETSWLRYTTGDGTSFGQVDLFEANLTISIQYITGKGGVLLHFQTAASYSHPTASAVIRIVDKDPKDYNISHGTDLAVTVSSVGQETTTTSDFATRFAKMSESFDQQFEQEYGLKEKNIVGFYSNMAKAALSTVLHSSLYQPNSVVRGKVVHKFNQKIETIRFLRSATSKGTFEDQIFPLLVIQKFSSFRVSAALTSWLNQINGHHRIVNEVDDNGDFILTDINNPLLFILIRSISQNEKFTDFFKSNYDKLDVFARKLASGNSGRYLNIAGDTLKESSLDHTALVRLSNDVMSDLCNKFEKDCSFYLSAKANIDSSLEKHWKNGYKNIDKEGRAVKTLNPYVPLILKLVDPKNERVLIILKQLENDENFSRFGLADGTVSIATNYLLIGSLKYYAENSGPGQQIAHQIYSQLKNNVIAMIARSFKNTNLFFERYYENGNGVGSSSTFGSLILLITSDSY